MRLGRSQPFKPLIRRFSVYGAGATQTLVPSLLTNTQTFYSPTVTPGAVTLAPSLFTNTNTFHNATVSASYTLAPSLFTNTNIFYASAVTRGAVTLTPGLFTNTNTFFVATVSLASGPQTLTPSLFTNTQTFYAATVTRGAVILTPSLFTNTNTFYSATITKAYTLAPSLVTNAQTFYAPAVTRGVVTLTPAKYTNTQTFFATTVTQVTNQTLTPALFTNTNVFFSAEVSDDMRGSRRLAIRAISEGYGTVKGVVARAELGSPKPRVGKAKSTPGFARVKPTAVEEVSAAAVIVRISAKATTRALRPARSSMGRPLARAGACVKVQGYEMRGICGRAVPHGQGRGKVSAPRSPVSVVGKVIGRGITNPTNEELAQILSAVRKVRATRGSKYS